MFASERLEKSFNLFLLYILLAGETPDRRYFNGFFLLKEFGNVKTLVMRCEPRPFIMDEESLYGADYEMDVA